MTKAEEESKNRRGRGRITVKLAQSKGRNTNGNQALELLWRDLIQKRLNYIVFFIKRDLISVLSNWRGLTKDTKRTRGRPDRNVAPCNRPITTVIGPLHECKKVCPCTKALPPLRHSRMNQARSEEEEKERKRDRKDRGQEADGKKGSPTKQKHIRGTKTRPTYLGTG